MKSKKYDSYYEEDEKKVVIEDDKESLIGIAIISTSHNVPGMLNIVRGNRNKVIEVVAKYFKEIVNDEGIHWKTEIPVGTFNENNCLDEIRPTEKISSAESDYYVKVRKIEEGTFIPFTSTSPEWATFNWRGKDMQYFHSLFMSDKI